MDVCPSGAASLSSHQALSKGRKGNLFGLQGVFCLSIRFWVSSNRALRREVSTGDTSALNAWSFCSSTTGSTRQVVPQFTGQLYLMFSLLGRKPSKRTFCTLREKANLHTSQEDDSAKVIPPTHDPTHGKHPRQVSPPNTSR